jgi:hypothetical protein
MFSIITNIYNKKTKGPNLMELYTATGKLKRFFFFWQLEMFDEFTPGDTAHIDTIFKFLPHTRQHGCIDILHCCNDPCLQVSEVTWQWYFAYFARNARCTVTTDLLVWYSNTQNDFSPERPFSYYLHAHRLAAEMWTTIKKKQLTEKTIFELFLLSVQVS